MKSRSKPRGRTASSVRQSVTIPAQLAVEVKRVARKQHLTLAQLGVDAEAAALDQINTAHRRFMSAADPKRKDDAGTDLIRAIFGKDSIAEDSILYSLPRRVWSTFWRA